jgi:hypothetical protein
MTRGEDMPLDAISATLLTTAALMLVALLRRLQRGWGPKARREFRRHWIKSDAVETAVPRQLLPSQHRRAAGLVKRSAPDVKVFARVSLGRLLERTLDLGGSDTARPSRSLRADLVIYDKVSKKRLAVLLETREPSERRSQRLQQTREWLFTNGIPVSVWRESDLPSVAAVREQLAAAGIRCGVVKVRKATEPRMRRGFEVQTQPSTLL